MYKIYTKEEKAKFIIDIGRKLRQFLYREETKEKIIGKNNAECELFSKAYYGS